MFTSANLFLLTLAIAFFVGSIKAKPDPKLILKPKEENITECIGKLCNSEQYPEKEINAIVNSKFNNVKMHGEVYSPVELSNSFDNMCDVHTRTITPTVATLEEQYQVYLVNTKAAQQLITIETCLKAGESCNQMDNVTFPLHKAVCEQLYSKVRLLYVNEKNELTTGLFSFPSRCVCALQKKKV